MAVKVNYDGTQPTTYQAFGLSHGRAKWFLDNLTKKAPYTQASIQPILQTWAKNIEEYAYFMYFVGTVDGRQLGINEVMGQGMQAIQTPKKS